MKSKYKISVLTPSFNSANYIRRAIVSVMNQDYSEYEHIVMDGGSSDGTVEILKEYPHLIWESKDDKGQSDAMNKAFKKSTGDIIVYLNADDWFSTGIFQIVAETFKSSNQMMIIGNLTMVYEDNRPPFLYSPPHQYEKCILHFKDGFPNNPISYFYHRSVQESIGQFDVNNHYTMDYDFILRALRLFPAVKLDKNFGYYWFDGKNKTSARDSMNDCRSIAISHCLRYNWIVLFKYYYEWYKPSIMQKLKSYWPFGLK